jgi:hypothetical protein
MRTTTAKLIGLVTLLALLLGGAVLGDPPARTNDGKKPAEEKKPSQLEQLIAEALQGNPDVRVAEAKMREAEAELNRTRLQVIQKVVAHQHTTETLEGMVRTAEARLLVAEANLQIARAEARRMDEIVKKGVAAKADVDAARAKVQQAEADVQAAKATLQAAKADHAKAQAELPYLLGKATKDAKSEQAHFRLEGATMERWIYAHNIALAERAWTAVTLQPQGTVADKLRKALDAPVSLNFADDARLGELLDYLQQTSGVAIASTLPRDTKMRGVKIDNVPLGAAFQCVEDVAGVGIQFGVREYGILVTGKLPPGVMPLHDFWKGGDKPKAGAGKK